MSGSQSSPERTVSFQAILDRLSERGEAASDEPTVHRSSPACDWTSLLDLDLPPSSAAAASVYADADWPDRTRAASRLTVREAVAGELRLADDLAPADLERIRRAFAFRNHPDRVGVPLKALALQRMTEANALIDAAIAAARARIARG